jgi:glycosyltransferase involved in cell wall biosynthesis
MVDGLQGRPMLSIIIATMNSERALVPTLAALVPGAMDGLVSEVIIADGGSRDGTATVADVAGCNFLSADADAPETAR